MENFLLFFEKMTSLQKLSWIMICLTISWTLEAGIPLVAFSYNKWKHVRVNLVFLLTSLIINSLFGVLTVGIFLWAKTNNIGLLYWVELPLGLELLFSIMMLDFTAQWFAHYLLHKVKWMWKFHLVHHSDTHVDATTGTRHHPGDYLIREIFSLAAILVFGIPVAFYLFYRILTIFFTYFTHANINLPKGLDKALSYVFVTPNAHKFHHHFERPWTDSNFGNVFSIWDRMFGTFVYGDTTSIRYGVDVLEGTNDESVAYQMKIPFDNAIKTDY
jgi:sterol desaturase/sphingolipid hydroxylase (fatty acid hydroxylase superfamily)